MSVPVDGTEVELWIPFHQAAKRHELRARFIGDAWFAYNESVDGYSPYWAMIKCMDRATHWRPAVRP